MIEASAAAAQNVQDGMHTEAEATRTLWCPFVRGAVHRAGDFAVALSNRDPIAETRCLGSGCMGWRWGPGTSGKIQGRRKNSFELWTDWNWDPRKQPTPGYKEYEFRDIPPEERRGYCGIAGKP